MRYDNIQKAEFLRRPNRFIAQVLLEGSEETVHVKNTGRCRELLLPGAPVFLEQAKNLSRKTKYSLISVYKGDMLVNIDSQVPNAVAQEALEAGRIEELKEISGVSREVTYGSSRFDIYFEGKDQKGFMEVKGVTLEENGLALFPDAPTARGTKHLLEMAKAREDGYSGYILFLIQMKGVHRFAPNGKMDPRFAQALAYASTKGVKILAYDSIVTRDEIVLGSPVDVVLP